MVDGSGPLPDSNQELLAWIGIAVFVAVTFGFFTGLDAQVNYLVSAPGDYFLSNSEEDTVVFSQEDVNGLNFASSNRVGFDSIGDEIGFCAGIRSNSVYDLRVADGFEETSRTSVTFNCAMPRSLVIHTQPDFSEGFSPEDLDYKDEFTPEVSCILYREATISPVSGKISGLNCMDVSSGENVVPVVG